MAKRKEPTMKLTNLIWVLALAGAAVACNSGPPITNEKPIDPGTGGTNGTGGISGEGACTTEENLAVYEDLVYKDCDGVTQTGTDASSAIGSDCIFGCARSEPPVEGCGSEAGDVVRCFPNCPAETIQIAADCVANCTQTTTAEIAPPGLSDECVACTGDTVACGAAFCTTVCLSDTNAAPCIECRCDNGCIPEFDVCSGLPSDNQC
jgi:hypothetical protein